MADDVVAVARVVEQGGVETFEQAVVDHDLLAAAPFLGRRAEEDDLAGELVGEGGQRDRRPDPGCGHGVVAAAVAEPGQRVVFGEDPDPRTITAATTAEGPAHRRRKTSRRVLHGEAVPGQDLCDPGRRVMLLEGRLWVGVDPVGETDDLVPGGLDRAGKAGLGLDVRPGRLDEGQ